MVNISSIQTFIKVFILRNRKIYNLLLSKKWIYKIYAVKNPNISILTINSINKMKRVVNNQEIDFLAIELLDVFEIKDFRINLADKKIDQLIDKTNKA